MKTISVYDIEAEVIEKISEDNDIPECYPCLGKTGSWYKINVDGKTGYVKAGEVAWHISEADCAGCIR